jgi:hypothetical protein
MTAAPTRPRAERENSSICRRRPEARAEAGGRACDKDEGGCGKNAAESNNAMSGRLFICFTPDYSFNVSSL